MQKWLLAIAAMCLLVGAGEPLGDIARARWNLPPGSKWLVVEGRKGDCRILKGSVEFRKGDEVKFSWEVGAGNGRVVVFGFEGKYELDLLSGLPRISRAGETSGTFKSTFRHVSGGVELRLMGIECADLEMPVGTLVLVLRREK